MACAPCAAKAAAQQLANVQQKQFNATQPAKIKLEATQPEDCEYTQKLLRTWYNALDCVKQHGKLQLISLNAQQANSYLGYLQSALNYPDNYCYYQDKLEEFKLKVLPRIIFYVPKCNN